MKKPYRPSKGNSYDRPQEVFFAGISPRPPSFIRPTKHKRGVRRQGVLYEDKVQSHLLGQYPQGYIASPWIRYRDANHNEEKWCQPDGILVDLRRGKITIVEVKLRHTDHAWFQLHELYYPVLRRVFKGGSWDFRFVEVVRWYDPSIPFPGRHYLRPRVDLARENETCVVIWTP